jgi:hypothetical protein
MQNIEKTQTENILNTTNQTQFSNITYLGESTLNAIILKVSKDG